MDTIIDLHVHTREGSRDSDLAPETLVEEAHRIGLTGVVLTEHEGWRSGRFELFNQERDHGLVLVQALEVSTDAGHVITFGLHGHHAGMRSIVELRKIVDAAGGFLILAHPFRFLFGPHGYVSRNILFADPQRLPKTPAEALEHPVFGLVDAIEVVNAGNSEVENRFTQEVAEAWGKPGTGGSDAHSIAGIGRGATLFHGDVRHERDLLDALRANAYTPVEGFNKGIPSFYGPLPAGRAAIRR